MSWKNTSAGYGWLSVSLHWLMLALLVAVYCTMEFKGIYKKGSPGRDAIMMWHYMLGLSVFFLVWLRALARLAGTRPVIEPALQGWQATLAKIGHWALYALMIGLPVLGWLTLSAKGAPIPFFGVELPSLIGKSEGLAKSLKQIHESVATAGYFIIGLHAAAALYHHYVRRDNTLRVMLPGAGNEPNRY
jgi:cytochrome b561